MSKKIYKNNWISIYSGFHKSSFRIGPASYFDDRAHIHIVPTILIPLIGMFFTGFTLWSLIFIPFIFIGYGQCFIDLPIRSGIDDSDYPEYGFYFYGEQGLIFTSFWWCWGRKNYCFNMPWQWTWVRTSIFKKDGSWEHETTKNKKDFYKDEWKNVVWKEEYSYVYKLKNGKIQERIATVKVEEREWRWKAFKWLPYPKMIHKDISVDFSYGGPIEREVIIEKENKPLKLQKQYTGEVGEKAGNDWKGGTLGCGYRMSQNETPLQTLRRMEKERIFN